MTSPEPLSKPGLVVLGDIGVDHVLGAVDGWPMIGTEVLVPRSDLRAGGSGGNTALAMARLGAPCRLLSGVGDDFFGAWLQGQFRALMHADLQIAPTPTTVSVCILHEGGERSIFTTDGHLETVRWDALKLHLKPAAAGSILLLSGAFIMPHVSACYADIIRHARALGYRIALDTGWPPQGWSDEIRERTLGWVAECDHVLLNEVEVKALAGHADIEAAAPMLAGRMRPGGVLAVKLGRKGAIGFRGVERARAMSPSIEVFDTVGAGDAFNAGYLNACLRGMSLVDALSEGCRTASAIIARFPRGDLGAQDPVDRPLAADGAAVGRAAERRS